MNSNTHENNNNNDDDDDCSNSRCRCNSCHHIMNEKLSYYEILNVPSSASTFQIKESYRTLIKQYHPDKCNNNRGNDSDNTDNNATTNNSGYDSNSNNTSTTNTKSQKRRNQFIQIQLAWECLRDSQLRYQYDQELLYSLQNKQQHDENKVEYIRQQKLQKNAIPIYITDCSSVLMSPEQDYDDNNNVTIDTSATDDDDEIVILDWIYQCRCGYDIFVAQQHAINNTNYYSDIDNPTIDKDKQQPPYDLIPYSYVISENTTNNANDIDPSDLFVQCTGCSLMYDLRPLFSTHER